MTISFLRFVKARCIFIGAVLAGCGGGTENTASSTEIGKNAGIAAASFSGNVISLAKQEPTTEMLVAAGEHLFKDPNLSASKKKWPAPTAMQKTLEMPTS